MNTELLIILVGIATVALLWLLLKFGRQIARVLLIAGVLVLALMLAAALLEQASATRKVATVATVASVGAAGASIGMVVLALVTLTSVGAGGYFWIRWKLAERRRERLAPRRERRLPDPQQPVTWYVEEEPEGVPLGDLDLSKWGW